MNTQSNQDDVAVFMKEQLVEIFADIADALVEHNATPRSMFHHDLDVRAIGKILALVQQSNRQLLDEVEESGPKDCDEMGGTECSNHLGCYECGGCEPSNHTNKRWHQAIQAIKERRGL